MRDAAGEPVRFTKLADRLNEKFADVGCERVEAMLRQLVAAQYLITSLRAPMTDTDPLGHLVTILQRAGACDLVEVAPLVGELAEIHTRLCSWAATRGPATREQRVGERGDDPTAVQDGMWPAVVQPTGRSGPVSALGRRSMGQRVWVSGMRRGAAGPTARGCGGTRPARTSTRI